ncbi:AAA family ATPase [Corynebacterium sp.]|uniref:AAA family ATPase n=1 Tax=Corynebacterium sp. TaxID=1720 RepID=UPI002A920124|nr:AAA family ATPase [Corynebacterium sp.]MDY5785403.1 AAA family ATPase [Corynebacterium sp.]
MSQATDGIQLTSEFREALAAMRRRENVLLTGHAGTGKSTLLRLYLSEHSVDDVIVTAPTGVAALNVGGFTIHRAFGFRPGFFPEDIKPGGKWQPSATVREVMARINVLVIDEISMVRADLFDIMDAALRRIRRNDRPFGGVQLILVGDLLQLAPVVTDAERSLFTTVWDSPYFFSAKVHRRLNLKEINLTTVWRQNDEAFIEILNEVREGSVGEGARAVLNERVESGFVPPHDWVTLAAHNKRVATINKQRLDELPAEKLVSLACFTGEADATSFNGTEELVYARGARVMTVVNDRAGRFVNGSFGEIIVARSDEIVVKIDGGETVSLGKHTWEVGRPRVSDGKVTSETVGTVTQFPVILAWAITIHKSQGQTIPKLFLDLTGGTSQDGQFYVALSRAVDLDNLRLSAPVEARHIRASNQLVRRLRRASTAGDARERYIAVSVDGVDFGMSQHVGLVHAIVVESGRIVADFGSWINPASDLGDFGAKYAIPSGGLAQAPTLGDFWPLLLRQAEGAIVVGHNLSVLERAVRHQERGMALNLGVGYDTTELNFTPRGETPAEQARSIADALMSGQLSIERGQMVPPAHREQEGAVFVPEWAPVVPMRLDARRATESDIAWAALSGGEIRPREVSEVQECLELMGAWATSRGMWTDTMREGLLKRANNALPSVYDAPPVIVANNSLEDLFREGTRVAFTGRTNLLGGPADDDRLTEICKSRGLVYKRAVSKTRCDVLVAGDVASMSRKAQAAREFGKPIVAQDDFERWYTATTWAQPAASESMLATRALAESTPMKTSTMRPPVVPQASEAPQSQFYDAEEVLQPGTRVAFRGSTYVYGKLIPQGEKLQQFCSDIGLEYKQSVTKTRCDVLVTDDAVSDDGKCGLARRYGKPMVLADNFAAWAKVQVDKRADGYVLSEEDSTVGEVVDENDRNAVYGRQGYELAQTDPEPEEMLRKAYESQASSPWLANDIVPVTLQRGSTVAAMGDPLGKGRTSRTLLKRSLQLFAVLSVTIFVGAMVGFAVPVLGTLMLLWIIVAAVVAVSGLIDIAQTVRERARRKRRE